MYKPRAIHTTLKRLNQAGEIRFIPRGAGKHAYLWQHPPTTVALGKAEIDALLEERRDRNDPRNWTPGVEKERKSK